MQADLSLCWSQIPLSWKSHVTALFLFYKPGRMKNAKQFTRPASLNFKDLIACTFFVRSVVLALDHMGLGGNFLLAL